MAPGTASARARSSTRRGGRAGTRTGGFTAWMSAQLVQGRSLLPVDCPRRDPAKRVAASSGSGDIFLNCLIEKQNDKERGYDLLSPDSLPKWPQQSPGTRRHLGLSWVPRAQVLCASVFLLSPQQGVVCIQQDPLVGVLPWVAAGPKSALLTRGLLPGWELDLDLGEPFSTVDYSWAVDYSSARKWQFRFHGSRQESSRCGLQFSQDLIERLQSGLQCCWIWAVVSCAGITAQPGPGGNPHTVDYGSAGPWAHVFALDSDMLALLIFTQLGPRASVCCGLWHCLGSGSAP